MKPNLNFSPLPMYENLAYQMARRKHTFGKRYPLKVDRYRLLPFQIIREATGDAITSAILRRPDGSTENVLSKMTISVIEYTEYDVIVYGASAAFASPLAIGSAYLEISDGTNTWYSEEFIIAEKLTSNLKLEFWNETNLAFDSGHIDYSGTYVSRLYLPSAVIRPEYESVREVTTIDGYEFLEQFFAKKVFQFTAVVPEYLADLIRLVPLHSSIEITDDLYTYTAIHPRIEPADWIDGGLHIPLVVKFEIDAIVRATGTLGEFSGKDFNPDFNADFLI